MQTATYNTTVFLPTVEEFAERFPQYGNYAKAIGKFLFDKIVTPECFIKAKVATIDLELPAVAGVAKDCYDAVENEKTIEWRGFVKQFIGAVVCSLMESNGFEKTGIKKSIPNEHFTKGEFYILKL
jgi:hypothetical protein